MCRAAYLILLCSIISPANAAPIQNEDRLNLLLQGRAEYRSGHYEAAETFFIAALRSIQRTDERQYAATLVELGDVYLNEEQLSNAERVYVQSLGIYQRLSDKKRTALIFRNLGTVYSLERRDDDALWALNRAFKLAGGTSVSGASFTAQLLNSLGIAYYRQGNNDKAEAFFNQALRMVSGSGIQFDTAELLNYLGAVYSAKHQYQKAEYFLQQAMTMTESRVGPLHPELTFTLTALGALYTETGRYAEAEDQYQQALKILEPDKLVLATRIARVLQALSVTYAKAGRKAEAEAALLRATVIARSNLSQHLDMAAIIEDYSAILRKEGKTKEAEELRVEAKRARVTADLVINVHNPS